MVNWQEVEKTRTIDDKGNMSDPEMELIRKIILLSKTVEPGWYTSIRMRWNGQ